jgi:hypothetical protein
MNANELRERLAAYADGELDSATRADVEQLLAVDAAAREEVERWQALRRAVQHAVRSQPVPVGLEARVRQRLEAARPGVRSRIYRLGFSGLAVAAAAVFAFLYWPQGASATPVRTADFARIYRQCAVAHRHDGFHVRDAAGGAGLAAVSKQAAFTCRMPDLAASGDYRLDGACACSPANVRVVHAYYRSKVEPQNVVSAFAVDRPMRLCNCSGAPCPCCRGRRQYYVGHDEDVTLVAWQDGRREYVLAARMDEQQLRSLADDLRISEVEYLGPALAGNGGHTATP